VKFRAGENEALARWQTIFAQSKRRTLVEPDDLLNVTEELFETLRHRILRRDFVLSRLADIFVRDPGPFKLRSTRKNSCAERLQAHRYVEQVISSTSVRRFD